MPRNYSGAFFVYVIGVWLAREQFTNNIHKGNLYGIIKSVICAETQK